MTVAVGGCTALRLCGVPGSGEGSGGLGAAVPGALLCGVVGPRRETSVKGGSEDYMRHQGVAVQRGGRGGATCFSGRGVVVPLAAVVRQRPSAAPRDRRTGARGGGGPGAARATSRVGWPKRTCVCVLGCACVACVRAAAAVPRRRARGPCNQQLSRLPGSQLLHHVGAGWDALRQAGCSSQQGAHRSSVDPTQVATRVRDSAWGFA